MKRRILLLAAVTAIGAAALTNVEAERMKQCIAHWRSSAPVQKAAITYEGYVATCTNAESTAPAPPGVTAKCRDGTYSASRIRAIACLQHGGIAEVL